MNDNEIIKALECCSSDNGKDDCKICPNFKDYIDCKEDLSTIALGLINRKDAEIERLGKELIKQQLKNNMLYETAKEAKAEAIKEFWKRFDKVLCENIGPSKRVYWKISSDGDNLVKEMTEQSVNYGSSKTEDGNG